MGGMKGDEDDAGMITSNAEIKHDAGLDVVR